jgi:hypothetical protein
LNGSQVGGSRDSVVQEITEMSYFDSTPYVGGDESSFAGEHFRAAGPTSPSGRKVDRAIDSALRSVPLPNGMMTRLANLICTMPDEAVNRMDYLGC